MSKPGEHGSGDATDGRNWKIQAEAWWQTSIIEMEPGIIRYAGYPVEELIGRVSFPGMIWLMLKGDLPSDDQAALLGHALVAAVDHGPQAPSIAIARMAATCGVGVNNAMASAINALGDVHGGAGEQAVTLYSRIAERAGEIGGETAVDDVLDSLATEGTRYVPGFGHRFHPIDPRAPRLLALTDEAAARGVVSGRFATIGRAVEAALERRKGRRIPMNIDGATAVIYAELGFAPPLCRGLFVLSRSVGILAHAWEQMQQPDRNKGPLPRDATWTYTGHPTRHWPEAGTK
ncbi:citryl-CoA lyase [Consotaella aegiceratis]|uniref:citryl-CoA lyase n=1 Tax=Consotaella aegiceratis TaxID=3097961 RepID=UPI002F418C82